MIPNRQPLGNMLAAVRLASEPYVFIEVEGTKCRFLVDTGATVSIVKPDTWQARVEKSNVAARGISGRNIKIVGEQEVNVKIGATECQHTFLVSEIGTPGDGLLGMDLLQTIGARVDLEAGILCIKDEVVPLQNEDGTVMVVRTPTKRNEAVSCPDLAELITPQEDHTEFTRILAGSKVSSQEPAWHAEVYLCKTTLLPPSAVRIVQGKITGRCSLTCPREVIYEPVCAMIPGVVSPRLACTVVNCAHLNSPPVVTP